MCVGLPGRIVAIAGTDIARVADVEFGPSLKQVSTATLPDASVGDWVIVHSGFVVRRLSAIEAAEAARHFADAASVETS